MYQIVNTDGAILGATDNVNFIKIGESGDFTTANITDAIGVALDGIVYNLIGHDDIVDAQTVVISQIDGAKHISAQQKIVDEMLLSILEG